jgi:peptide/nickel transport system substrate-binding protein
METTKRKALGLLTFPVIPKHIFHENKEYITANDEFGRATIIGSGPYRFKRWIPLRAVQLDRYPEYFEKFEELPKKNSSRINKITMQYVKDEVIMKDMLVMGRLDLIPVIRPVDYDEIRKDPFCDLIKYNSKKFAYFAYNCNSEFFKDKRVRLAISYALDRKAMLKQYMVSM